MEALNRIILSLAGKIPEVRMEKKCALPRTFGGQHWNMQGGGTDGRFAYYVMNTGGDSTKSISRIYKIDLQTWQIQKISGDLYMSHANDIAYDSLHHRLIIPWCDVAPEKIAIVDPDTLELLETKVIPQRHFSLDYCGEKNLYVAGKSRTYDLVLLSDDFTPVRTLVGEEGYVKQGLACDSQLIYFFQTGKNENWIFVYDWDGALVQKIPIPMVGESENLFVRGGKLICAFNDHDNDEGAIYEVTISEKVKRDVNLIILAGMPASGKTTFVKKLSAALKYPVLEKDAIKEELFDVIGFQNYSQKRLMDTAATAVLLRCADGLLESGQSLIMVNNFRKDAEPAVADLLKKHDCHCVFVFFSGDGDVFYQRYVDRDNRGERHLGHVLQEHYPPYPGDALTHTMTREEFAEKFEKLGMDEFFVEGIRRIDVDATWPEKIDTQKLIHRIQDCLQGGTEDG